MATSDQLIAAIVRQLPEELVQLIGRFVKPWHPTLCPTCGRSFDPLENPTTRSKGQRFYCSKYCFLACETACPYLRDYFLE